MERRNFGEGLGNRPDMAYFLLLGLCGAAFLLTIGGILTYVAFNPGSIDGHPHSALSHIPHFHHHTYSHHSTHHQNSGFHHGAETHHPQHHPTLGNHTHPASETGNKVSNTSETTNSSKSSSSTSAPTTKSEPTTQFPETVTGDKAHHSQELHPLQTHHDLTLPHANSSAAEAAYEAKAKQSLILAIIGPLCLLMGIIVAIIVGVLGLKYDCDHEPEPNISFLRLRSEMSINFDPDKNNYELLRPSSSIEQAGGHFSINPTGLPDASS